MPPRDLRARGVSVNDNARSRGDPRRFRGAGLVFWFRADLGVTIATGVSQWDDQSGVGNTVAQGTGTAQPTVVAGAFNGKPALHFEAAASQRLIKANTNLWADGPYAAIAAVKSGGAGNFPGIVATTTAIAGAIPIAECGANRGVIHSGTAAMSDAAVNTTSLEVQTTTRAAAAVPVFRVNGAVVSLSGTSATLVDPGGTATFAIGADDGLARFWTGDLAECAGWTTALNVSMVARLNHRLGALYGAVA